MVGEVALVEELLKAGANVNARSSDGVTPLQDAVLSGHHEVKISHVHKTKQQKNPQIYQHRPQTDTQPDSWPQRLTTEGDIYTKRILFELCGEHLYQ